MEIVAKALTQDAFAPYGKVLAATGEGPQRDEFAGRVESTRTEAKPNLTFLRVEPKPSIIEVMEQHPYSTQLFVPMNGVSYLIGVCPSNPEGGPDFGRMIVFVAKGGQAVTYNAGTWHAPLCALDRVGEFVMLRWDDGGPEDTVLVKPDDPIKVTGSSQVK